MAVLSVTIIHLLRVHRYSNLNNAFIILRCASKECCALKLINGVRGAYVPLSHRASHGLYIRDESAPCGRTLGGQPYCMGGNERAADEPGGDATVLTIYMTGSNLAESISAPRWKVPYLEGAVRNGLPVLIHVDNSRKTFAPRYPVLKSLRWERNNRGKITQVGLASKLKTHLWFSTLAVAKKGGTGTDLFFLVCIVFWFHILGDHRHCGPECSKGPPLAYQETSAFKKEVTDMKKRFTNQRGTSML